MSSIYLKKFLIRVIWICTVLAVWVPLLYAPRTLYPFIFPKIIVFQVLVEVSVIAWALLLFINKSYAAILKHPITLSLFVFLVATILSSLFGVDPYRSFFSNHERMTGVILMAHLFAWYLILASVFRTAQQWRKILWTTLMVSLFMGVFSIDMAVIGDFLFHGKKWQPLSPLGNPIYLGVYAMIHAFLSLVLYIGSSYKPQRLIAASFFLWNLFVLYISASRGPLIAFTVGIMLCIAAAAVLCRSKSFMKRYAAIMVSIMILAGVVVGASAIFDLQMPYVIKKLTSERNESFSYRLKLWGFGIDAFKEKPLFGWGWENFYYYYNQHYKEPGYGTDFTDTWVDKTHNQLIDILANGGIVGIAAYSAVWIIIFFYLLRYLLRKNVSLQKRFLAVITCGALTAYFIQNLSIFDSPAPLILFYLLIAFAYWIVSDGSTQLDVAHSSIHSWRKWHGALLLGAIVVMPPTCAYAVYALNIAPYQESTRVVNALGVLREQPEKALVLFKEAFKNPTYISSEGRLQFSGEIVNTLLPMNASQEVKKSIVSFSLDELKKSMKDHPSDVKNIYAYAMLSRMNYTFGETDLSGAKELMRKAALLAPYRSETLRESYELYSMTGDVIEATKWAELYGKNFNQAESHYLLGMMHLRNNDFKHAIGEFLLGDRQGYNAFQNKSIFRFIGYNIPAIDVTKEYLAFVDRGVEYYPDNVDLLTARIIMHYKMGDREVAKRYMSELNVRNAPLATEIEGYLKTLQ